MMFLSKKGAAFIRLHEGFRSEAYIDPAGVLTIGIGFTWRSDSFRQWWRLWKTGPLTINSTMTEAEADDALQFLVSKEYGKAVNDFLGKKMPQHVYDAMVSATFNLGPKALTWKWAAAAKAGNYAEAARLLRRTGTTATDQKTGKRIRLNGLVRRRKEEAILIEKGIYTGVRDSVGSTEPAAKPKRAPAKPNSASPKPNSASPSPAQPAQEKEDAPRGADPLSRLISALLAALAAIFRRNQS